MRHLILRPQLIRWGTAFLSFLAIVTTVSLAQTTQQVLLQETFRASSSTSPLVTLNVNAPGLPCLTAGPAAGASTIQNCALAPPDAEGAGTLRLTTAAEQHASGFVAETSLPTAQGLEISFTQYQYGGYGLDGPGSPGGADGISFFMAVAPPSPDALGSQGGALGYASAGTVPGLPGAWLGIGLDAFGNFSNPAFGSPSCPVQPWAGFNADAVTVRGPGNGIDGYCLLASSVTSAPGGLGLRDTDRATSAREITIRVTPSDGLFRVYVDDGSGAVLATSGPLPTSYFDPSSGALTPGLPPRVTFGFAASTGSATDIHEISGLTATTTSGAVPVLSLAKTTSLSGAATPGQAFNYLLTPRVEGTTAEARPLTIRLSDDIPAGLVLSGTPSGTSWLCSATSTTAFTCSYTKSTSIPGGTTLPTVTVPVIVDSGVASGTTIVNTASVLSDDAAAPATASVSITMNATPPLTITTATLPDGTVGTAYNTSLAASGGTGSRTWSLANGTLPSGLTLSGPGVIAGTPTASGTSSFTVRVTDGAGTSATRGLSITTSSTPSLVITTSTLPNGTVGAAYSAPLAATGGSGARTWSLASGTLPSGLTLSTAGVISGTPTAVATSSFTVRVTDAAGTATTRALSITIARLTISTTSLPSARVGQAYTAQLAATGGSGALRWTLDTGPMAPGLTLPTTGLIAGTPTTTGVFAIVVRVTDGGGATSTRGFNLQVLPPVLTITTIQLAPGEVGLNYAAPLAATGGTSPYAWSLSNATLPPGLALTAQGSITGKPTTAGTSVFSVRVTDSQGRTDNQRLSITVLPALTITTTSVGSGVVGTRYSLSLARSGGFAPFTWTVAAGALPPGLTLSSAGVLSGTPTTAGTFSFTVRVRDSLNATASRAFSTVIALRNEKAYIAERQVWDTGVSVVNVATGALIKRIPTSRADGVLASSSGKRVYYWGAIGIPNEIGLIDTSTDTVVRTASISLGSSAYTNIEDVKLSPDNTRLYVVASINTSDGATGGIFVLNAGNLTRVRQYLVPQGAIKVALSSDGETVFVSTVEPASSGRVFKLQAMSTSTGEILASRVVSFFAYSMLVTPAGDRLVVSSAYPGATPSASYRYGIFQYSVSDLAEISRTETPGPLGSIDTADNSFVSGIGFFPYGVVSVQLATGVVNSAPIAGRASGWAIDRSGQYGYTTTYSSAAGTSLLRVDLSSLAMTAVASLPQGFIPGDREPVAIAAVAP